MTAWLFEIKKLNVAAHLDVEIDFHSLFPAIFVAKITERKD